MLSDTEIKQAVYEDWRTEPIRPPRVQLNITDEVIFAVDANMYLHATRKINLTQPSYATAIRHELRHLSVSPVFWSTWGDWATYLAKIGYKADETQRILNMFTDLEVDYSLHKDYAAVFEKTFQELLAEHWVERPPWLLLYLRAHEKFMQTNFVPEQSAELEKDAEALMFWCTKAKENYPIEERLKNAAEIISRYPFVQQPNQPSPFGENHGHGQGQPQSSQEANERMAEKALEKGLTPQQAKEAMQAAGKQGGSGHVEVTEEEALNLLDEARARQVFRKAIKVVSQVKGRSGLAVDVPEVWRIGDRPELLDIAASAGRFGHAVIPGITTMKTTSFQVNKPLRGDSSAKLCVALDESSSVNKQVWELECAAAVGLVAWAMEKKYACWACKFDSPEPRESGYVTFEEGFSFAYWNLLKWLVRRRLNGGTEVQQVFEALVKLQGVEGSTIVVLTDAGIAEVKRAQNAILTLANKKCVFRVIMIGQAKVPEDLKNVFKGLDIQFFAVPNVTENLTEMAIRSVESC